MKIALGILVNDKDVFLANFEKNAQMVDFSSLGFVCSTNPESASAGLNALLDTEAFKNSDIGIFIHQDVLLKTGWIDRVRIQLRPLKEWGVAGVWGMADNDSYAGNIIDSRFGGNGKIIGMMAGDLPCKVESLDEVCLIVNLKTGFRFDEELKGFDLYGTYICLWMQEHGHSAYAINAPIVHNTKRSFDWEPDEAFMASWELLKIKFPGKLVTSTVYQE